MNIETVRIELLKPNPWNPNEMGDDQFNLLTDQLDEEGGGVGYIDPIQVVPLEDGTYQIIGGEHRMRAMRALGHEEMEVVVLGDVKWKDEDLRKFVTTRLNAIHGKLNPKKFMELYLDLSERHAEEALQGLMGFADDTEFKKLVKDTRKNLKEQGLTKDQLAKFDDAAKEVKTVDDLSIILNKIFNDHGDTLSANFMVFTFGGKEHLMIQMPKKGFALAKKRFHATMEAGGDVGALLTTLLEGWDSAGTD